MATPVQQQITWQRRTWRGFTSHTTLKQFFDWCFEALAIMAVPLTIACSFIIAGRLSSPAFFQVGIGLTLSNFAENGLNAVIEGSILGCIAIAKKAKLTGNAAQEKKMSRLKWLFAALAITTIGFWVFKANQDADNILLLVRCGAAVLYCIVVHSDDNGDVHPVQITNQRVQDDYIEELRRQIAELANAVSQSTVSIATLAQQQQSVQPAAPSVQHSTETWTPVQAVQIKMDTVHAPVHVLNLLNITREDEQAVIDQQVIDEGETEVFQDGTQVNDTIVHVEEHVTESALQEDAGLDYPVVAGISDDIVKQIITLHLAGVAWSAIAERLGKNYKRTIMPVKAAWTQATNEIDTEKLPVQIDLYRQAII